ncbi:LAG1-domain-containing protein [Tilletiaria anomala UBC 951]|uniref:LAG1-domain-containing protein n=1 Tax=Tilletiaria anomala (strain ATCC 24038 / CBS 436.72 / UBC 951) TaxID=1037660 RepID=A0A066W9I3_TILAU|nr:LAG1-domain-containing protein [Tilletiaria anomala UBC 951]KDN47739.1 LAG1-domain-containing protein [Tilletiaria anomala UBC 951]
MSTRESCIVALQGSELEAEPEPSMVNATSGRDDDGRAPGLATRDQKVTKAVQHRFTVYTARSRSATVRRTRTFDHNSPLTWYMSMLTNTYSFSTDPILSSQVIRESNSCLLMSGPKSDPRRKPEREAEGPFREVSMSSSVAQGAQSGQPCLRNRSSSVSKAVNQVSTYADKADASSSDMQAQKAKGRKASSGILSDLVTLRWMIDPVASLKITGVIVALWAVVSVLAPHRPNPFSRLLFISHRVPVTQVILAEPKAALSGDTMRYQKGWYDLSFIAFYIIVFSFIRQSITLWVFKPFALWWGIKNETKQTRLMEQGYAFCYWGSFGLLGLYVMKSQDNWWYQLEHLWLKYPHWQMRPELKYYYLLQLSYWLQQAFVMLLRLEKPRKDYYELVAHHLVTLWLIGWSYLINMTMIGTTVFVCMDIPDTWLAMSKFVNYLGLDNITTPIFATFIAIWTYFRIYLSARTLWSVWFQFDLIPAHTREWNPAKGWWLAPWMRYQIFAPLFLLLLLNLFWYYLMWRIAMRTLRGIYKDEREEGEYEDEEEDASTAGKKKAEASVEMKR